MEQIKIIIKKDGTLSYEVQGVVGSSCEELTRAIDELGKVTDDQRTGEYYGDGNNQQLLGG